MSTLRKRHLNPDWLRHTSCMQQHRNKLYRVRFYEVAYRRVCYNAVYNGGLFYELLGGGVLYLTGSIGVVELDLTARVAKLHTKDHFLFFCLFVIFHTFIFFVLQYQECLIYQPNLALILGTPVSLMTHSQRYLLFIRRFNPVCK